MSNDKTPKPVPKGAVRIQHVKFVTSADRQGVTIASPREAYDQVPAREENRPGGYDIWFLPERRAFRFDHYDGGKFNKTKMIPEANVFSYEEMDQSQPGA